jgi:hypothetical protein
MKIVKSADLLARTAATVTASTRARLRCERARVKTV